MSRGRKRTPLRELSIDEMAFEHLNNHPNDKSGGVLARMNRRFGKKATNEALRKASEVMQMMGVELSDRRFLTRHHPNMSVFGRSSNPRWKVPEGMSGKAPNMIWIDEASSLPDQTVFATGKVVNDVVYFDSFGTSLDPD